MWLYVPEPSSNSAPDTAGSASASSMLAPEFVLWVLSSGKPMPLPSSQVEWQKMPWIHVLSGTIWNPSTASSIATAWISSLQASPAKAPASQASDSASTTSDGCGRSSGDTCSTSELGGSSSRTCPASSALTVAERSRKSSGIWHKAGGMRSGSVSPRPAWAPRTSEPASTSLLPTPTASAYGSSQNGTNSDRPSGGTMSLHTRAARGVPMIPTPTASDCKRTLSQSERDRTEGATLHEGIAKLIDRGTLPTPTATDCKASGVAGNWTRESGRNAGATLTDVAGATLTDVAGATLTDVAVRKIEAGSSSTGESTGNGGMLLNPRFVEWMMGLPPGWALTPINSTCSATALSRKPRPRRSPSSGAGSTAQISLFGDLPDDE